jgi:nanoRNase/pAp phosphatase (c-di-AMP/oligoRNAs hydrolase)
LKRIVDEEAFAKTMEHLDGCSKVPLNFLIKNINKNFVNLKQRSKELENFISETLSGANVSEYITKSGKQINYILVDKNLLDRYQIKDSEIDVKDVLSYITSLYKWKCDVVATIWERDNGEIRLSLRSNDVDLLSTVEKLDGGGHKFAAGASLKGSLADALDKFLKTIDSEI